MKGGTPEGFKDKIVREGVGIREGQSLVSGNGKWGCF